MVKSLEFRSVSYNRSFFYNPLTGISQWVSYDTPSITNVPEPWKVVISQKGMSYYYNPKTGISQWQIPKAGGSMVITGLNWTGNSCYMDSVLQALFAVSSSFATKLLNEPVSNDMVMMDGVLKKRITCVSNPEDSIVHRTAIQGELKNIANTLRGVTKPGVRNVTKLRSLLAKCPVSQKYHGHGMQDSGEFLTYLLDLFSVGSSAVTKTITYGTNTMADVIPLHERSRESSVIDSHASVVTIVDPITLLNQVGEVNITEYLSEYNDSQLDIPFILDGMEYMRRISRKIIVFTPIIIFNFNRRNPVDDDVIDVPIRPVEKIDIGDLSYTFSAVVQFSGGAHYICYYACDGIWYLYNDIPSVSITLVGTLVNLLENTSVMTHGTTFYYTSQTAGIS